MEAPIRRTGHGLSEGRFSQTNQLWRGEQTRVVTDQEVAGLTAGLDDPDSGQGAEFPFDPGSQDLIASQTFVSQPEPTRLIVEDFPTRQDRPMSMDREGRVTPEARKQAGQLRSRPGSKGGNQAPEQIGEPRGIDRVANRGHPGDPVHRHRANLGDLEDSRQETFAEIAPEVAECGRVVEPDRALGQRDRTRCRGGMDLDPIFGHGNLAGFAVEGRGSIPTSCLRHPSSRMVGDARPTQAFAIKL